MTASTVHTAALRRLRQRAQFLKAAGGDRAGRAGFSLQVVAVGDESAGIGFTVTKKTGNSPQRNRIKRRLREAARACITGFRAQHDYVLIGRRDALDLPFDRLVDDLASAIAKVHAKPPSGPGISRQ